MKRLILAATASTFLMGCPKKETRSFHGEAEATQIDVGVKVSGRISRLLVSEGQDVTKETVIGILSSREISAKLQSAKAGSKEAKEQLVLATNTFERMKKLFKSEAITQQQFEEARYRYEAARQKLTATEGVVDEVDAAFDETHIKAPIDGEIVSIVSNPGELISPGYPVVTLVDLKDQWVTFNVREDDLKHITKGSVVSVRIPALDQEASMKVTYISSLGAFAKWKSTGESGRFDLKTFEVRVRPDAPIPNLRPGMSALIKIDGL